jgi:mRNA-degrading endonuclease RelE of RelBE toxin-antitoxin system
VEKTFNDIKRLAEFESDLKKLSKKYHSLEEDLEIFITKQLKLYHKLHVDNGGIVQIPTLGIAYPRIYKARKFACKSLKGKGVMSGIRVIYAYLEDTDVIELIEIYYKGDKENEDKDRILRHYKKNDIKP